MTGRWADASKIPFGRASAHFKSISKPAHVRSAATQAGNHLVRQMSSAIRKGPEEHHHIADSLLVWHSNNNVHVGVHPSSPNYQQAVDHEWGTVTSPPKGIMRSTIRKEFDTTRSVFHNNLLRGDK